MATKLHIDLTKGIVEVEGSEDFVKRIYEDFREASRDAGVAQITTHSNSGVEYEPAPAAEPTPAAADDLPDAFAMHQPAAPAPAEEPPVQEYAPEPVQEAAPSSPELPEAFGVSPQPAPVEAVEEAPAVDLGIPVAEPQNSPAPVTAAFEQPVAPEPQAFAAEEAPAPAPEEAPAPAPAPQEALDVTSEDILRQVRDEIVGGSEAVGEAATEVATDPVPEAQPETAAPETPAPIEAAEAPPAIDEDEIRRALMAEGAPVPGVAAAPAQQPQAFEGPAPAADEAQQMVAPEPATPQAPQQIGESVAAAPQQPAFAPATETPQAFAEATPQAPQTSSGDHSETAPAAEESVQPADKGTVLQRIKETLTGGDKAATG